MDEGEKVDERVGGGDERSFYKAIYTNNTRCCGQRMSWPRTRRRNHEKGKKTKVKSDSRVKRVHFFCAISTLRLLVMVNESAPDYFPHLQYTARDLSVRQSFRLVEPHSPSPFLLIR